jgi:plastocyanin
MIRTLLWRPSVVMLFVALVLGSLGASMAPPAGAQTVAVGIAGFKFNPATLTIPVGTTVTWTNSDTAPHTATSDSNAWTTPMIQTGQSASITFTQAGTFPYHCSVHPNMKATIIVQSATTPVPLSATKAPPVKVLAKEANGKYVFGPVKTKIKLGQTVMWKNSSDAPHTVTSTSAGWTYDKKLNTGASLKYTFKKAGTFHYKCVYHPGMVGTVIVTK